MTRERANDLLKYWPIIIALVLIGMYMGRLDNRVTHLEQVSDYVHGTITVPAKEAK